MTPAYLKLARQYRCATVMADSDEHPPFADLTGDFVNARLMRCDSSLASGYPEAVLGHWADRAKLWAGGGEPADLPRVEGQAVAGAPRDVFIFFISGAKERAPAAAMELLKRLG